MSGLHQFSLSASKLVAFVATTDFSRAKSFYGEALGLRLVHEDGFALVFDVNGTMLRISLVEQHAPAGYTALGWEVADIRAGVRGLTERGVAFQRYEWMPQDEQGVWTSPDGSRVAWFQDPDGNTLSLTQSPR